MPTETAAQRPHAQARMQHVLRRLGEDGPVSVAGIAAELRVSEMTVRRDLADLARRGLVERVHGGAIAARGPMQAEDGEPAFAARARRHAAAKARIALAAAGHVAGRSPLALDLGTTVLAAVRAMIRDGADPSLRVFTHSLRAAQATARAGIATHLTGGLIRAEEMSLTGPEAVESFARYYFDVALLGASGLTGEGIFDYSPEEVAVKAMFIRHASERVLLLDSSKFRRVSTVRAASLTQISTLITDAPPPPDLAAALAEARVRVIVAPEAEG